VHHEGTKDAKKSEDELKILAQEHSLRGSGDHPSTCWFFVFLVAPLRFLRGRF